MQRIVIDTNVLVSASIASGYSFKIFDEIIINENNFLVCLSDEILAEYLKVAYYERIEKKYPLYAFRVQNNIRFLKKIGKYFFPSNHFQLIKDVSDNSFLDLSYEAHANYLITGNHNDFTILTFEATKIVSPKIFCELYYNQQL